MSNTLTGKVSGRMSSRGWAIALGIGAIVLAAILLIVYLDRYRARVSGENAPTPVLVANRLIPKGTPGSVAATSGMYTATTLPRKDVVVGAIEDPSYLSGRAASEDVFPGAQLTAVAFSASDTGYVDAQITGFERAFSISIDNVRCSCSQLQTGDHVDVYTSIAGVVKLFEPDVEILAVPSQPGPSGGGNMILKTETRNVANFIFVAENTQLWFVLRPVIGAKKTANTTANAATATR